MARRKLSVLKGGLVHPIKFPRLVADGDCNGISVEGYPFITSQAYGAPIDSTFINTNMKKYDMLIVQPRFFGGAHTMTGTDADTYKRLDILNALRTANPNLRILAHIILERDFGWVPIVQHILTQIMQAFVTRDAWIYDLGTGLPTNKFNLAYKSGGKYIIMEQVADYMIEFYHNRSFGNNSTESKRRIDGYKIEFTSGVNYVNPDFVRAGYPTLNAMTAGWQEAVIMFNDRLRDGIGPYVPLIGLANGDFYGGGSSGISPTLDPCTISAHTNINGWVRENFHFQNGGTFESNMVAREDRLGDAYMPEQFLYRPAVESQLYGLLSGEDPLTADSLRRARYIMGSAALGNGYATHGTLNNRLTTGSLTWGWPWETRSWGDATSLPALDAYGVWNRWFREGKLRVNPPGATRDGIPSADAVFIPR